MAVRWLQLTDIHEHEVDERFRKLMYERIVEEVKKAKAPDFVFLTGDMANHGRADEYESLETGLIAPLLDVLPPGCPIFSVPGNHDVDRNGAPNPRDWFSDNAMAAQFQSVSENGRRFRHDKLYPRFAGYAAFEQRVAVWGSNWLDSAEGSVCWSGDVNGAKLAVVGINTAWLCQDRDDSGKLTPGRYMLEAALSAAAKTDPELLIVLGHHPLRTFVSTGEEPDHSRVRDLLIKNNALYLHGDQHVGDAERIGESTQNMLAVQAPAAYQAADDRKWRNGLMWGEADVRPGWLMIEPKLCNDAKGEFKFDNDAGWNQNLFWTGDRNVFRLHLPGRVPVAEPQPPKTPTTKPESKPLPSGWIELDRPELQKVRKLPPSRETMGDFFDGEFPSWQLALAPGIEPRAAAARLATHLRAARAAASRPRVALVVSGGSEGKSTALIHAAAALVGDPQQSWTCLYRQTTFQPLPAGWLASLPRQPNHAWVVAIDEADNIARSIREEVEKIATRGDIHLLLAARDAEWQIRKIGPSVWNKFCDFTVDTLRGLDEADARRIVAGWSSYDDSGRYSTESGQRAAVAELLSHARDGAARNEAGELLGALLQTRTGEQLQARVGRMLEGLRDGPPIGRARRNPLQVYAMIAAMHAENQLYLSRFVLAHAIGSDLDKLDEALRVLRRETRLLDSAGVYVLTRHRRIAEAACAVLREDHTFDLDELYPMLASSARKLFLTNRQLVKDDIADWNYKLADHFVTKGPRWWRQAQAVARALHEAEPTNAFLLTGYCKILRMTSDAPQAMAVMRAKAESVVDRDRAFFYDWSTVAGMANDHGLSIWLAGHSLADGEKGVMDARRCELSLAGLTIAFGELQRAADNKVFARAEAACAQLGLLLPGISNQTRDSLRHGANESRRRGIDAFSANEARKAIYQGVIAGAAEVDPADGRYLERLIQDPDSYKYSGLLKLTIGQPGKT